MRGKIIDCANGIATLLTRLSSARATKLDNLDAAISTTAPAATAVDNTYYTNALATALGSFLGSPPPSTFINSVQAGLVNVNSGSWSTGDDGFYTDVTITSVNPAKCLVIWQSAAGASMARVQAATNLRVSQATNTPGQLLGRYQVVEFK